MRKAPREMECLHPIQDPRREGTIWEWSMNSVMGATFQEYGEKPNVSQGTKCTHLIRDKRWTHEINELIIKKEIWDEYKEVRKEETDKRKERREKEKEDKNIRRNFLPEKCSLF